VSNVSDTGDQQPLQSAALSTQAVTLLGSAFIDFALNGVSPADVAQDDAARHEVLAALESVSQRVLHMTDDFSRRNQLIFMLSAPAAEDDRSLSHAMYSMTGGTLPDVQLDDDVARSLAELALAAFPIQLLPPSSDPFGGSFEMGSAFHQDPAYSRFNAAVYEDQDLRKLFPDPIGESSNPQSFPYSVDANLMWSAGGGGTLQLVMVAYSALNYTFTQMRLADQFVLSSIVEFVVATVETMRKLARDKRATVPYLVSLSNLSVDAGLVVSVGNGRVQGAEAVRGHLQAVDQSSSAVLVLDVELRLLDVMARDFTNQGDNPQDDPWMRRWRHRQPTWEAAQQALAREVVRARLALALASTEDEIYAPMVRGQGFLNPLAGGSGGGGVFVNPFATSLSAQSRIDARLASEVTEWGRRVAVHPDSMWMGARRLLSAMAERGSPLDAFIDAVVCWENLLGAETEVTFRVSSGLALLLEPDDAPKRLEVFNEIKSLYGVRSSLIHGSKEPPRADSLRHAQRAIRVGIDAMRAIYDRPELLEATSSGMRNRRLLLGA
jgi:hypothetical protein